MSSPIGDRLEHELGVVFRHGKADVSRVWQHITSHHPPAHYDPASSNPKETPVSLDTIRIDFASILDKAEQDAAKVARYESEPLVQGVLAMIETMPVAREILVPVLAGLGKLAAAAPPADPAAHGDPQVQTGVAQ